MNLSIDEWTQIFEFAPIKDLYSLSLVSSIPYYAFVSNNVWKPRFEETYKLEMPSNTSTITEWLALYRQRRTLELRWIHEECREVVLEGIHQKSISALSFHNGTLYTGSYDGAIGHWDIISGRFMRQWKNLGGCVDKIEIFEKYMIADLSVLNVGESHILVFDLKGGQLLYDITCSGYISLFTIVDGKILLCLFSQIQIYSLDGGNLMDSLEYDGGFYGPIFVKGSQTPKMIFHDKLWQISVQNSKIKVEKSRFDVEMIEENFQILERDGIFLTVLQGRIDENGAIQRPETGPDTNQDFCLVVWEKDPIITQFKVFDDIDYLHELEIIDSYHHQWIILSPTMKSALIFRRDEKLPKYNQVYEIGPKITGNHDTMMLSLRIDAHRAYYGLSDCTFHIYSLETGQCIGIKSGFYKKISKSLITPDILFLSSADSSTRIYNYSDTVMDRYKPLNYEILTPKEKITPIQSDKKNILLVLTGALSPIHLMHIKMMENMKKRMELEGFAVVGGYLSPSHDLYNKYGLLSAIDRIEMCELAVKNSNWIMVDKWEAAQSEFQLQSDVLKHLQGIFPEVEVIYCCGTDNLAMSSHVLKQFRVICHVRPEYEFPSKKFFRSAVEENRLFICNGDLSEMSSSLVRSRHGTGSSFDELLDPLVAEYVNKNKLFDQI